MESILLLCLFVVPLWRICARVGLRRELSLLALVPVMGVAIVGLLLSIEEWQQAPPAEEE